MTRGSKRQRKGVRPTPRAEALWDEIRDPLHVITQVLTHSDFDPGTISEEVIIGLAEDVHKIGFAHLVSEIRKHAPGLTLRVREVDHQSLWQDVGDGRVDLAVSVGLPPPKGLGASILFEQPFLVLHRPDVTPPTSDCLDAEIRLHS